MDFVGTFWVEYGYRHLFPLGRVAVDAGRCDIGVPSGCGEQTSRTQFFVNEAKQQYGF